MLLGCCGDEVNYRIVTVYLSRSLRLLMMHYRSRVLAAFIAATFASSALSQELGPQLDRPDASILKHDSRTEVSSSFPVPSDDVHAFDSPDSPLVIEADHLTGHYTGQYHAQGQVMLRGQGLKAWADDLFGSIPDNEVSGSGNVKLDRFGDVITGDRFYTEIDTSAGFVERPTYFLKRYGARGKASFAEFADRDHFRAKNATYTTCDLGQDDWYLKVSQLDIDRVRDVGVARNVTLRFKEIPILYTPWIDFPVSSKRKSGLLAPIIGTTQQGGFELTMPLYLNLAPNYDATISPRYIDKRGILFNNEVRYLTHSLSGELRAEYLQEDRQTNTTRSGFVFKHYQDLGSGFFAAINLNKVSDDRYFVDLSDKIAVTSQTNLPREASLVYNAGWWNLNVRTQRFQTLQDPLAPVVPPYGRVPQVTLNAGRPNERGFDLNFFGEVVDFRHPTQVEAVRQLYYPSVQMPVQTSYVTLTPKVGLHYRRYRFTNTQREDEHVTIPIYSLDSSVTLERDATLLGQPYVQTLEPRLYYVHIPFKDQSRLPLFDTAVADFSLGQIFTENQFSGGDRVNDANQLTAAVTSRLLDVDTGEEYLRGILGQRYYFKDQEVSLNNNQVREFGRSDILAALSGRLTREWSIDSAMQYDVNIGGSTKFSSVFRYRPEPGRLANFAYRYQRDFLETVDISSQWPLSQRWTALGRWNYSLRDRQIVEGLAGLEYNARCWAVRAVAHRFATATGVAVKSFFVQFEFTGLAGLGSSPLDVLRQNIGGYSKTNELPTNRNGFDTR